MSRGGWLWIALGVALWGAGVAVSVLPRGLRLNNPMNLRRTADKWLGLASEQPDPAYFSFIDYPHGLRAGGVVLRNYASRYGLNTVRGIIRRYAPEHENPTDAYIANVAGRLRVGPDDVIDVNRRLPELMRAIVIQEQGAAAEAIHVPAAVYDAALALLGWRA